MARFIDRAEQQDLYCVPLNGIVLFPHIPISVELHDQAQIRRCEDASRTGALLFFAVAKNSESVKSKKDLAPVGCVTRVRQLVKLPDGSARILAEGRCRARVSTLTADASGNIRVSVISVHSETEPGGVRAEGLIHDVLETLEHYVTFLNNASPELTAQARTIHAPGELADYIAAQFLLRYEDKLAVLQECNPLRRLELLDFVLAGEADILDAKQEIHKKVRQRIDHSQRVFYLREQLRVIQNELNETEGGEEGEEGEYYDDAQQDDLGAYAERIAAIKGDENADVREKLSKELRRLSKMPFGSAENSVLRAYLDICLDYPWCKRTNDRTDLALARRILDRDHEGLEKVKERILEYLAVRQTAPELKNQILCLVGPPGVGKSSVAASVAAAMNRKFVRVSLGGIRDEADIRGHRKTYVGAMPGRIVAAITQSGVNNPLILLDELDKLTRDAHGDPASALLEVLDPEQNKAFRDHFTELPMDLSNCVFIATANTLSTIPAPLLDRVEIIEIQSYSEAQKIAIAQHHLIPKQLHRHGLTRAKLRIREDAVRTVIRDYTKESGVRGLEKEIAAICRKAAVKLTEGECKSITVTERTVASLLGPKKVLPEEIPPQDEIGEVNGLAWTEAGGDMLRVEAIAVPGTGKLELTGSLGDVMKESVKAALTFIRSRAETLGIDPNFAQKTDLHVHFPEGAVPKDGPSAGVTVVTALASALSDTPVRRDLAMTGEVTLRGRVLPIGGLREKTMAAVRAGVHTVLYPQENERDLEELDPAVRDALELIPVSHADDVLRYALLPRTYTPAEAAQAAPVLPDPQKKEPLPQYRTTRI